MEQTTLARRTLLCMGALSTTALDTSVMRSGAAAGDVVANGKMVLAWHTNIAPRWLDPLQHDGGATPDNFLNVLHDALIKNFRDQLYDHLALAERYELPKTPKAPSSSCARGSSFTAAQQSLPRCWLLDQPAQKSYASATG